MPLFVILARQFVVVEQYLIVSPNPVKSFILRLIGIMDINIPATTLARNNITANVQITYNKLTIILELGSLMMWDYFVKLSYSACAASFC